MTAPTIAPADTGAEFRDAVRSADRVREAILAEFPGITVRSWSIHPGLLMGYLLPPADPAAARAIVRDTARRLSLPYRESQEHRGRESWTLVEANGLRDGVRVRALLHLPADTATAVRAA